VSVRLVQYYFGTKDELLLSTHRHVAERATARVVDRVAATDGTPREVLLALLSSFVPTDAESRETMLVFVALQTASFVATIAGHLRRADLAPGVDAGLEAAILAGLVPSLAQSVLEGLTTAGEALGVIGYAVDRAIGARS
jgi:AcrR family transcriptional regulator